MTRKSHGTKHDIFLSHSAKDQVFVSRLASDLAKEGLRVWLDQWNIRPGDSFAEAIGHAMRDSHFLLIVMSPDYFQSAWTSQEWQYGLAKEIHSEGVRLIPLLYRDCDIPPMLRAKQWVDFRDAKQYPTVLARLVSDLRSLTSSTARRRNVTQAPKPGERLDELDPAALAELKTALREAVEAFRGKPEDQPTSAATVNMAATDAHMCFIVMPFSVESLNIVYEDFVKPTLVDRCQLRPVRGDDVFGSNVVMDDITTNIRKARLIIADLTGRNPNVFYEVGIAHALNKQVLLMTQSIDDVPFDLRHRRALVYEYSPRGCKKLEKDLYDNVENMLESGHED